MRMAPLFPLRNQWEALALALVAAHGATDVDVDGFYYSYVAVLLLPAATVTPLFCLASLLHFAADVGLLPSAALHCTAFVIAGVRSHAHGMQLIFLYLLFVHVPMHYWRCFAARRLWGILGAALATGVALAEATRVDEFRLTLLKQRIVIAHVLNEFYDALSRFEA
jgi:hypothetical protein